MAARYTSELANGIGNLASRVLAMAGSYFEGRVPEPSSRGVGGPLADAAAGLAEEMDRRLEALELNEAYAALDAFVREANRYLVEVSPWVLAKDPGRRQELADSLYASLEALRLIAVLGAPVMPAASESLWDRLGTGRALSGERLPDAGRWGLLEPGTVTTKGEPLFPRLEP